VNASSSGPSLKGQTQVQTGLNDGGNVRTNLATVIHLANNISGVPEVMVLHGTNDFVVFYHVNGGEATYTEEFNFSGALIQPQALFVQIANADGLLFTDSMQLVALPTGIGAFDFAWDDSSGNLWYGIMQANEVPEPSTWLLLLGGFGILGMLMRLQRVHANSWNTGGMPAVRRA
jgi:PEP-CTERM motif